MPDRAQPVPFAAPGRAPAARRAAATVETVAPARAADLAAEWQALAERAVEPNAFLEPWFLLPALQAWGAAGGATLAVVRDGAGGPPVGLVPLCRRDRLGGRRVPLLAGWHHPHSFLGTPLVAPGAAARVWRALRRHAADAGAAGLSLDLVPRGAAGLADEACVALETHVRAALRPDPGGAAAYLARATSAGARKDWRRQRRRLAEAGALETRGMDPGADPAPWIEAFLALEAAGWKGRDGTALASTLEGAGFFRAMAAGAAARGRLHMMGLFLNGVPIALQCNLISRGQGFAFKVAYAEQHAATSPGVLLELDAIAAFHDLPDLVQVDSCTWPGHPLMARLWHERLRMERVLVPAAGLRGASLGAAVRGGLALRRAVARFRPGREDLP